MKKPENKKPEIKKETNFELPEFAKNVSDLDPKLAEELEKKGLVPRWVSMSNMEKGGGYHPKGWKPYIRESSAEFQALFGKSADGITRRGDLVLAVKDKAEVDRHRAYLQHEAKASSVKELTKRTRKNLKEMIKEAGLSGSITLKEGYED